MAVPAGYTKVTLDAVTAKGLSDGSPDVTPAVLAGCSHAVVKVTGAGGCRWRDDGTPPTTANGLLEADGTRFVYDGLLTRVSFIGATGAVTLDVVLYSLGPTAYAPERPQEFVWYKPWTWLRGM